MTEPLATSLSLLARLGGRDSVAWERLVTLYRPLVLSWCLRSGLGTTDADDVAQEVFVAVATGLASFKRQREGSFRAWVRGITRHKLLDHARRVQREGQAAGGTEANERLHGLPDPQNADQDALETSLLYRRALDLIRGEFEEKTWEAFWRSAVEEQDTAAVAAALGMSSTAVRIAKSRVLARLREEAGELLD
ncbi:MAG: sigma-70 family RNA polymerase sigma factor [Gemmataceae bacterium]